MQYKEKIHPMDVIVKLKISDFEKLLLFKIINLDNTENGCYAKDEYFALYFDKHLKSVNRCISKFEKMGLIIKTHPNHKRKIRVNLPKYPPSSCQDGNPSVTSNQPSGYHPSNPSVDYNTKDITKENKQEREDTPAFDFLKTNYKERFENEFQKKFSKLINDKEKFKDDFNSTVEIENKKLRWSENSLFNRLLKYARNWVNNDKKYNKEEPKRVYLMKVR
jgi:hypothetical protein